MRRRDDVMREEVEKAIRDAFAGVRLGDGISLREAEAIDDYYRSTSYAHAKELRRSEVTDDWGAVPAPELDRDCIAHLDPEGLRYYLPAFMLRLLNQYDPAEMWCIGTISALDQREGHPIGFLELLSSKQRTAIAIYVKALHERCNGGFYAGCNYESWTWEIVDGRLVVSEASGTLIGCGPVLEAQDVRLRSFFGSRPVIGFEGDRLVLDNGRTVIIFEETPTPRDSL